VPLLPSATQLSHTAKDALIAALTARLALADERIAAQEARILVLEARLDALSRPPKTPGNSSPPPSQGQKQDRPLRYGSYSAQKSAWRGSGTASEPRAGVRAAAGYLSEMRGGILRRIADAAPGLCPH